MRTTFDHSRSAARSPTPAGWLADDARNVRHLYVWSFGLRFGAGMLGWLLTVMAGMPFLEDAFLYEKMGAQIAQDWMAGHASEVLAQAIGTRGVPWLMAATIGGIYWLTGGLRIVPLLLAGYCALTAITPVLTYRIARHLGMPPRAALFSGRLVGFSPAFAFWSGALYKEGLVLLMLNLCFYCLLHLQQRPTWHTTAGAFGALAGIFGLRFYLAALMTGVALVGLALGRGSRHSFPAALRQIFLVAAFSLLVVGSGLREKMAATLPSDLDEVLQTLDSSRQDLGAAASGFSAGISIVTPGQAAAYLPLGLGYFLFSPMPWQVGQFRQNMVIPETLAWVCFYPLMVWGVRRGLRANFQGILLLAIAAGAISCFYALFAGNIGTVYRMRIQLWLILAIFAGWGRQALWEKRAAQQLRRELPEGFRIR